MEPYELLEKVVTVLERLQIRYLVTGSIWANLDGHSTTANRRIMSGAHANCPPSPWGEGWGEGACLEQSEGSQGRSG